jgi:hypothetical protein
MFHKDGFVGAIEGDHPPAFLNFTVIWRRAGAWDRRGIGVAQCPQGEKKDELRDKTHA